MEDYGGASEFGVQCVSAEEKISGINRVELTEVMEELQLFKMWIRRLKSKAESHRMEKCRLESVILGLQKRAEREKADLVEMLEEVTQMEKDTPKFYAAFAALAIEPM